MKLSMMSASLSIRGLHPARIAAIAAELGLDGIEWVTDCHCTAEELRRCADAAGLPVVCHTFFSLWNHRVDPRGIDSVKRGIDYALTLGAPMVMVPFAPIEGCGRFEAKKRWMMEFQEPARMIREAGLEFAIENFAQPESPMVTADDFFAFHANDPDVKLVFDDGNAASAEDEVASCDRTFDFIRHVHFKDWRFFDAPGAGRMPCADGRYAVPALIGEGDVNTVGVWNLLCSRGYSGFVSLEYESRDGDAVQALGRAVRFLKSLPSR